MSAIDSGVNPEHIGVSRAVSDCQNFKFGSRGSGSVPGLARCHLAVTEVRVVTGVMGGHGRSRKVTGVMGRSRGVTGVTGVMGRSRGVTGVTGGHGRDVTAKWQTGFKLKILYCYRGL